ncbi:MAG: agmatine deiminase family protein [Rhodospirillaceae bacterium]|nr:agmatine deiminase family protein [Rhodospirillales bacterium]
MPTMGDSPRERGWRPAPAWTKPGRFWMVWPPPCGDKDHDEAAREDCLGLAELLSDYAPVSIVCPPHDVAECALRSPTGVGVLAAEHDGSAICSHAPLWLLDGEGKLTAALVRSPLSRVMAETAGVQVFDAPPGLPATLEMDGEGTALVRARSVEETGPLAAMLEQWLGLEQLVWLAAPQPGASLGARFLAPGIVGVTMERDERHPFFAQSAVNRDILADVIDARGRRLVLVELPSSKRKGGCYADCLVAGERVVVPEFEDGRGNDAFAQVAAALPHRKVAAFPSSWIAPAGAGLGSAVVVQPSKG